MMGNLIFYIKIGLIRQYVVEKERDSDAWVDTLNMWIIKNCKTASLRFAAVLENHLRYRFACFKKVQFPSLPLQWCIDTLSISIRDSELENCRFFIYTLYVQKK